MIIAERGVFWLEIEVFGKTAHAGEPHKGINAIDKSAKIINKLNNEFKKDLKKYNVGNQRSTINVGIVSGGENVYPAEVENALMAHENITDAAVIGIPDNKWGETVKGIVVVNEKISDKEIIDFVKTKIASYKCPKSIDFAEILPRNPSGKILRRELRAPYWEGKDRNIS